MGCFLIGAAWRELESHAQGGKPGPHTCPAPQSPTRALTATCGNTPAVGHGHVHTFTFTPAGYSLKAGMPAALASYTSSGLVL